MYNTSGEKYQKDLLALLQKALSATTRKLVVKFNACYEDLPALLQSDVQFISLPFNDEEALTQVFTKYGTEIAAVIMEPALTCKGLILPQYGFLDSVREVTQEHGAALIFDEQVTGCHTNGGCQNIFEVEPDFTCWGDNSKTSQEHYNLESMTAILTGGLARAAKATGVPVQIPRLGSMYSIFFSATPVTDYASAAYDGQSYQIFHRSMAKQGVELPPTQFATNFITAKHTPESVQHFIDAATQAFAEISQNKI